MTKPITTPERPYEHVLQDSVCRAHPLGCEKNKTGRVSKNQTGAFSSKNQTGAFLVEEQDACFLVEEPDAFLLVEEPDGCVLDHAPASEHRSSPLLTQAKACARPALP